MAYCTVFIKKIVQYNFFKKEMTKKIPQNGKNIYFQKEKFLIESVEDLEERWTEMYKSRQIPRRGKRRESD